MDKCEMCRGKTKCFWRTENNPPADCPLYSPQPPQTKGDRFRAMDDERLATYFAENIKCHQCLMYRPCAEVRNSKKCIANLTDWLRSPAEGV